MTLSITPAHLDRLILNPWFGTLTRNAFDILLDQIDDWSNRAIVYFDIDGLKQANDRWGKAGSSKRIADALAWRAGDIGCWFSGDEFAAIVPVADALEFAQRIQSELRLQEMSATIVILSSPGGREAIDRAETLVSECKTRARNTIYVA